MNFTETLQNLTGKPLADCTDQELYLALLELVRQKSADRVQPVTGRKLYYISAEFLIGKLPDGCGGAAERQFVWAGPHGEWSHQQYASNDGFHAVGLYRHPDGCQRCTE